MSILSTHKAVFKMDFTNVCGFFMYWILQWKSTIFKRRNLRELIRSFHLVSSVLIDNVENRLGSSLRTCDDMLEKITKQTLSIYCITLRFLNKTKIDFYAMINYI